MTLIHLENWQIKTAVLLCLLWSSATFLGVIFLEGSFGSFVVITYFLKTTLLFLPLVVINNKYGLHPLIFIGLWTLITESVPEYSVIINGLPNHPGLTGLTDSRVETSVIIKLLMDSMAIGATYLGFIFSSSLKPLRLSHPPPRAIRTKLLCLIVGTIVILFIIVSKMGSIEQLVLTKGKYLAEELGGGHWNLVTNFIISAVWLAAAFMKRPARSTLFWVSFGLALTTEFLVTASRGATLMVIIVTFLIFISRHGRFSPKHAFVVALMILLALGFMTQLRAGIQSGKFVAEESESAATQINASKFLSDASKALTSYAGSGNSDYAIYSSVGNTHTHIFGNSYVAIFVAPIPRALWPDKPRGVAHKASEAFFPDNMHNTGVPPSPAGEAFWNFGGLGVFLIFFLWGALLRLAWISLKNRPTPGFIVVFIATLLILRPHTNNFYNWIHLMVPLFSVIFFYCFNFKISGTHKKSTEVLAGVSPQNQSNRP